MSSAWPIPEWAVSAPMRDGDDTVRVVQAQTPAEAALIFARTDDLHVGELHPDRISGAWNDPVLVRVARYSNHAFAKPQPAEYFHVRGRLEPVYEIVEPESE